jgi:hypothetical protein
MIQRKNSLEVNIGTLAVILFPFWTLPFLPGAFKPISTYIFCVLAFSFFFKKVDNGRFICKTDFYLLLILILTITHSVVLFYFYGGNDFVWGYSNAMFFIGVCSYFGIKNFIRLYSVDSFVLLFKYPILIFISIGWLELLGYIGILPLDFKHAINLIVSGKEVGRMGLTTSEPAWASRVCSILIPFAWVIYKNRKTYFNLFSLFSLCFFFIVCFSLSGVVVFFTAVLFYFILFKFSLYQFFKMSVLISIVFAFLYGVFVFLKTNDEGSYYLTRFEKVEQIDLENINRAISSLAILDGSAFIRIGYPIVSFRIAADNPLGVGIGRYGEYFPQYIKDFGSAGLSNQIVESHLANNTGDQRTYYGKILSETGVFISIIFIYFYYLSYKRIKKHRYSGELVGWDVFAISLFVIMLGNMVQLSSYLMLIYWLVPALMEEAYNEKNK